jgi:hypothetical protein
MFFFLIIWNTINNKNIVCSFSHPQVKCASF